MFFLFPGQAPGVLGIQEWIGILLAYGFLFFMTRTVNKKMEIWRNVLEEMFRLEKNKLAKKKHIWR